MRAHEPLALLALLASRTWCGLGYRINNAVPKTALFDDEFGNSALAEGLEMGDRENLNESSPSPPMPTSMAETEMQNEEMSDYIPTRQDSFHATAWARDALGLSPDSSVTEVRKAYRKLALKWHPDRVEVDIQISAKERFQDIQTAYSILTEQLPNDIKEFAAKKREAEQAKRGRENTEPGQAGFDYEWMRATKAARGKNYKSTFHSLVGVFVVAKGLTEAVHLNGKAGKIKSFDKGRGRYLVDFEKEDVRKLLKPDNLDLPWSLNRGEMEW